MRRLGETQRGRRATLATMLEKAAVAGDYTNPWARTPAIWRHFTDEGDILRGLQRQWSIELGGALFAVIRDGAGDLASDVAVAHAETVARHHALYRVIEAHAEHPAIAEGRRKERRLLASAGLRKASLSVA